ncbi:DUF4240 domain-containing protein [Streptomyces sp. 184]|uniref:DUF4240 domain-containing protein n=1 Tax=Streptomyces sp. 184 TaxID=1827526 RepID=UPI0038913E52
MDIDRFWGLVESARSAAVAAGEPFDEALVKLLAGLSTQEILEFEARFSEAHDALYRWDVWAAAYLIGGGCSDDSFIDFRAGVIALGREWYERAAAEPDGLAGHPAVTEAAQLYGDEAALLEGRAKLYDEALFYEEVNYAAGTAFERRTGDRDAFYAARAESGGRGSTEGDMGEAFDFDDDKEMHRRLPRLAGLFLEPTP